MSAGLGGGQCWLAPQSNLVQRFGSPAGWISASLLAFGLAGILANSLIGTLSRRIISDRIVVMSLIGSSLSLVSLIIAPVPPWLGLTLVAALSFFANLFTAPQQARLIGLNESNRGLMLALNSSVLYLGISLGSWLGSALLPVTGARWLALPALVMVLVTLVLNRPVRTSTVRQGQGATGS